MRLSRICRVAVAVLPTAGSALPAMAQDVPKALHGKSAVVSWVEEREQRTAGQSAFRAVRIPQTLSVYFSQEGRMFSRRTATTPSGQTGAREAVSGGGAAGGGNTVRQFRGRSLTVTSPLVAGSAGALNIAVDFDAAFRACRAKVIVGKLAGSGIIRSRSFATGEDLEIKSTTPTAVTCAVEAGNVFAQ